MPERARSRCALAAQASIVNWTYMMFLSRRVRAWAAPAATVLGLAGAARIVTPAEPIPAPVLPCAEGSALFDGACRARCTSHVNCTPAERCAAIDSVDHLCVPLAGCEVHADDTSCVGDLYALLSGGCVGNGGFAVVAPEGEPSCARQVPVKRCTPTQKGCELREALLPERPKLR